MASDFRTGQVARFVTVGQVGVGRVTGGATRVFSAGSVVVVAVGVGVVVGRVRRALVKGVLYIGRQSRTSRGLAARLTLMDCMFAIRVYL